MAFQKGVSGNPAGRKPGIIDKRQRIAQFFEKDGEAIAQVVIDAAKAGEMRACELVLARVSPPAKPRGEKVKFALDINKPLAQQAASVVQAVADGLIEPEAAQIVLSCLSTYAALVQADELEARISQLERVGGTRATSGILELTQ